MATSGPTPDYAPSLSRDTLLNKLHEVCPSASIFTVVPGYQRSLPVRHRPIASTNSQRRLTSLSTGRQLTAASSTDQSPVILTSQPASSTDQTNPSADQPAPRQSAAIPPDLPQLLTSLYNPDIKDDDDLVDLCSQAFQELAQSISHAQASNLSLMTTQQSDSSNWFEHRIGRITASHMHDVMRYSGRKYPTSIVKSVMQYSKVNPNVAALKWGREHEPAARRQYSSLMKKNHRNFETSLSGLMIDPSLPYLGATPDGISKCDCCGQRIVEIKCPYKYRLVSPDSDSALSDPKFCLKLDERKQVSLSKKHQYYIQVQGQLLVSKQKQCDFICWTTEGMFVQTISRDSEMMDAIATKSKTFFTSYLLPELLTHRLKRGVECEPIKTYCYCGKPAEGLMIGCDNESCALQWFHYKCAGIKRKPKGNWFCKNCISN